MKQGLALTSIASVCISLYLQTSEARGIRVDTSANGWGCETVDVNNLPGGLNFPSGLLFSPLGTTPLSLTSWAAAPAAENPSFLSGWIVNASGGNCPASGPSVLVYDGASGDYYDAQTYSFLMPDGTNNSFYANTMVWGLDLAWVATPQSIAPYAQVLFFYLGSPPGTHVYDAQFVDRGQAADAWEIEFNCVDPSGNPGCPQGASLQLSGGVLYVATAQSGVLIAPVTPPSGPSGEVALNEFVFNGGQLYPPPGWLKGTQVMLTVSPTLVATSGTVTATTTVTEPGGTDIPVGRLQLISGSTMLGSATLSGGGLATIRFSAAQLEVGSNVITASYQDDSQSPAFAPSTTTAQLIVAAAPTVTIGVNPTVITVGQSATITWSSANASSCTGSGAWSGTEAVNGTLAVKPTVMGSLSYTLECTGAGGSMMGSATLTVHAAPSGGGGGTVDGWDLLGLGLVGFVQWRRRARFNEKGRQRRQWAVEIEDLSS